MNASIVIDPTNLKDTCELMEKFGNGFWHFAKSPDGSKELVNITKNYVQISHFQANGWIRTNRYYHDGNTEEEYYKESY